MPYFANIAMPTPEEMEAVKEVVKKLVVAEVMTGDEGASITNLTPSIISMILDAKRPELDEIDRVVEMKKQKKDAYKNATKLADWKLDERSSIDSLQKLFISLDGVKKGSVRLIGQTIKNDKEQPLGKNFYLTLPDNVSAYLLKLVEEDKAKKEEAFESSMKPKKKGGGGGAKSKFMGEKVIKNPEPADHQGATSQFFFKGDEEEFFDKPSGKIKDGKQTIIRKAIKSERYMGGKASKVDDGYCCGAVAWDRSQGSKVIKDAGLSYALFKQRCGGEVVEGQVWCSSCGDKGEDGRHNFFTDSYEIGKGKGKKHNGTTYKEFIENHLVYEETDMLKEIEA